MKEHLNKKHLNKKQLNIGLVGYKFMGKAHSNAYARLGMFFDADANVNMKVLCGRDGEWLARAAQKLGWEQCETSWENLVQRDDIDAVDITAPSNAHRDIAIAAAENGKAVFCEKPLAISLADARQMRDAAVKNKIVHQIGFNYRFAPAVLLAKKLIDQGKLGKIYHFRGCYLQDWIIDPDFPMVWRLDKSVCGSGSHGDLGAHVIDMARFLVGEFDKVTGMSKTFVKQRPIAEKMEGLGGKTASGGAVADVLVDDATAFVAEFKCGALGVIEATRFAAGHKNDMYFEVNGSKGSIKYVFERMNELQYYSVDDCEGEQGYRLIQASEPVHPYMSAWWPTGHVIGYEHTFVHELYQFVQSVANNRPASPDFTDGVKCCQILEAVDLSIQQQQWIKVDDL